MHLADLTAYAREKYHISEQHKWADFPGFSVLADPVTGKWAALLMRQWDSETGEQIERCDIKCGRACLDEYPVPWLSGPFRMHGQKWVGVRFDERTVPEIVCGLLDRALRDPAPDRFLGDPAPDRTPGDPDRPSGEGKGPGSGYLFVLGRDFEPWKKRLSQSETAETTGTDGPRRDETDPAENTAPFYVETPLPGADTSPAPAGNRYGNSYGDRHGNSYEDRRENSYGGRHANSHGDRHGNSHGDRHGNSFEDRRENSYKGSFFQDSLIPGLTGSEQPVPEDESLPAQIRGMKRLYKYRDGTFRERGMNFYIQGKFMEDYEDDVPWHGDFHRYFPTYHDLRDDQLRGYFTWRTGIRKGIFEKVPASLTYIYIYELLNGIGASSPEESLQKLKEFEDGYLEPENAGSPGAGDKETGDTETGNTALKDTAIRKSAGRTWSRSDKRSNSFNNEDALIRKNLHRWMLEFAVLHEIAPETACRYADPEMIRLDHAMEILRKPQLFDDQEIFDSLCLFAGKKTASSPVIKKTTEGIHLFAESWRYACGHFSPETRDLFHSCFGHRRTKPFFPLGNVMYGAERQVEPVSYVLNPCRKYTFDGQIWREKSYQAACFDRKRLAGFLHETDRQLRLYLKAGSRLKEMSDEAWAAPYVLAVIEEDKAAKIEAAKPRIHIRFSDLEQIRKDALETRDSLLTEEERLEEASAAPAGAALPEDSGSAEAGAADRAARGDHVPAGAEMHVQQKDASAMTGSNVQKDGTPEITGTYARQEDVPAGAGSDTYGQEKKYFSPALDEARRELLHAVLRGESVRERIAAQHGMPEIEADALNEALFDEIGDSVVECVGDEIVLIEDYREDIVELLGEG